MVNRLFVQTVSVSCCVAADAVRDAGDRPGGLAEKHNLQSLCPEQQTDPLVLAGWYLQVHTYGQDWLLNLHK